MKSKIPAGKFPVDPKIALPENDLNPGRNLPVDAPGAVVAAATIHGIRERALKRFYLLSR